MPPEASPADKDAAASGDGASRRGSRTKATRFQYATGDRPLAGYTIKRGVGRGGFGEVYFATSEAGKEVALKLIRRNLDIELRGVRHCLNLKHPNLVALYDLRTDDADDQWVVMEYVAGESLEDAINRHPGGMPVEEALEWFRGIAAGVAHLHSSGVVHRDLKPGNIYLERGDSPISQRVKIGDYGLSKFISTSRRSGQTESVGTVHYMAPEISGGRYGREIDSYALGVILYEMLTGRVPFDGESVGEVLMKHLTAEPDLARVAEPYRSIVAGALAKDPELRLSRVEEMVALLPGATAGPVLVAAAPPAAIADQPVWTPVSRPPHTHHPKPPREPLWQYAVEMTDEARQWWREVPLPPLGKGLIFFAALVMLIGSGSVFAIPLAVFPVYIVWYLFWSIFLKHEAAGDSAAPAPPAPTPVERRKPNRPLYDWRAVARATRRRRPTREKAASLTGAMLASAVAATLVAALLTATLYRDSGVDPLALGAWLAAVIGLGSWGVIVSGAFSDAHFEDKLPRRGLNLALGVGLGAAAFGLASLLGLSLPFDYAIEPRYNDVLLEEAFDVDLYQSWDRYRSWDRDAASVVVPLAASMAYFGLAFTLINWWKSTDFLRRSRVGFWSLAATALAAFVTGLVTWYPQPLGWVVLTGIALATQAASPWAPPSLRLQFARGPVQGGVYDA